MKKIKNIKIKTPFFLLLISGISILFFKILKKKKVEPKDPAQQASDVMQNMGISPADMTVLNNKALLLAEKLGTSYSWYNPVGWTEDDEAVYDIVKSVTQTEFDILSKLYFQVYAKGRSLSQDLASLLDAKYYEKLIIK